MVANLQTLGTVFVGVITSAATWLMFGKTFYGPTYDFAEEDYNMASVVQQQPPNRYLQPRGQVPETMYPKQTELRYFRTLPKEGDALVLVSASWLPSQPRELQKMRNLIDLFWQKGHGDVKVGYLSYENHARQERLTTFKLPIVLIIKDGHVVNKVGTSSNLLSEYRKAPQKLQPKKTTIYLLNLHRLNALLHTRLPFYFLFKKLILAEMRLVEAAKRDLRGFYTRAVVGIVGVVLCLRLLRTRPHLVFGWMKQGISLFPSPFAASSESNN